MNDYHNNQHQSQEYCKQFWQTKRFIQKPLEKYQQSDSGFKAWDSQSMVLTQNNTNLLRNLKSQLVNYQEKYKKQNTLPIKLPSLNQINNLKYKKTNKRRSDLTNLIEETDFHKQNENKPNTQRKLRKTLLLQNKQNLYKHRSIQISHNNKSSNLKMTYSKRIKSNNNNHYGDNANQSSAGQANNISGQKLTKIDQNHIATIDIKNDKPFLLAKVQQMKFIQNQQTRIRKRDIYLAIFGQRGKGKVQKISFDDYQNQKLYQQQQQGCLQKKNHSKIKQNYGTKINNIKTIQKQQQQLKLSYNKQQQRISSYSKRDQLINQDNQNNQKLLLNHAANILYSSKQNKRYINKNQNKYVNSSIRQNQLMIQNKPHQENRIIRY